MFIYKIPKRKLEEHLGKELKWCTSPFRSWYYYLYTLGFALTLVFLMGILFLVKNAFPFTLSELLIAAGIVLIISGAFTFFLFRRGGFFLVSEKIKALINDPEVVGLNFYSEEGQKKIKRSDKGLTPENFLALAYLKKYGTSNGLCERVRRWQDSSSARKCLKRMALRGLVEEVGGDFQYVPWEFVVVDDFGEAVRSERLLQRAWEDMIEGEM